MMRFWRWSEAVKVKRVEYECIGCDRDCITTDHNLRYRQHRKNELYCQRCLIKLGKAPAIFKAVPKEYHRALLSGEIDHAIAYKYLLGISTSIKVRFACHVCYKLCLLRWSKMLDRRNDKGEAICYKCLQTKINTSPTVMAAHRSRTEKLWQDAEFRREHLVGFESHRRRLQTDQDYAAKHKRRCRSVAGTITLNGKTIRFDSAYELIFIAYITPRCLTVRRCEFTIAYGKHYYHPDFFVIFPDNKRVIIEIKGFYNNRVAEKQVAAQRYVTETGIADLYELYDTDRLLRDGVLRKLGGGYLWKQISEVCKHAVVTFSEAKHRKIAEIGVRRYRKTPEYQIDHQKTVHRKGV